MVLCAIWTSSVWTITHYFKRGTRRKKRVVSCQLATTLVVQKPVSCSEGTRLWVAGDTNARPQNMEGMLEALTFPVGNSYKGQGLVAVAEVQGRKAYPGVGRIQESKVEQSLQARADCSTLGCKDHALALHVPTPYSSIFHCLLCKPDKL